MFYDSVADLRAWVAGDGTGADGALLGFHRVRYGAPPPPLRVDAAAAELAALGWVETGRERVDDDRYAVRFAPGKARARRAPYATDEPFVEPVLPAEYADRLRADPEAWAYFEKQPPRYRRTAIWWVTSGKSEETRERRINALAEACAAGQWVPQLQRQL